MLERRDFLHLMGLAGLALVVPKIELEIPMELSDIWLKIANNAQLTPQEKDFLARQGRETQQRNAFIAGNTTAAGQLIVPVPFFPIFSETLQEDKSEININIPSGFNHIMVFGSVENSGTYGSLAAQFNGDTGSNYNIQYTTFGLASAYTSSLADDHFVIGRTHITASGDTSSFVSYIPAYFGNKKKICIANSSVFFSATVQSSIFATSTWMDESIVTSIRVYPLDGSLVAGSVLSIYGIA